MNNMATFESLPTELRLQVLQHLDLPALGQLIQASPIYHNTYLQSKKILLHNVVRQCYGHVGLADPIAAVSSINLQAEIKSHRDGIISLLDHLRRRAETTSKRHILSPDDSLRLLHLYQRLKPLLTRFLQRAPGPVSPAERARILRALCRLQTYSNIFGAREWSADPHSRRGAATWYRNFTLDDMWALFFGPMTPWEVEEFGSVSTFLQQEYSALFAQVARDVGPRDGPAWQALRPDGMPVEVVYGSADEEAPENKDYNDYCNHLVALGPCFLATVLAQPTAHARNSLLAANSIAAKRSFDSRVSIMRHRGTPMLDPADRYDVPGVGALLSSLPVMDQPASGWSHYWYGAQGPVDSVVLAPESHERTMGNSHGWQWGYALWDVPA